MASNDRNNVPTESDNSSSDSDSEDIFQYRGAEDPLVSSAEILQQNVKSSQQSTAEEDLEYEIMKNKKRVGRHTRNVSRKRKKSETVVERSDSDLTTKQISNLLAVEVLSDSDHDDDEPVIIEPTIDPGIAESIATIYKAQQTLKEVTKSTTIESNDELDSDNNIQTTNQTTDAEINVDNGTTTTEKVDQKPKEKPVTDSGPKITVAVKCGENDILKFRLGMNDTIEKLMKGVAKQKKVDVDKVQLRFDGMVLQGKQTLEQLMIEDEDMIEEMSTNKEELDQQFKEVEKIVTQTPVVVLIKGSPSEPFCKFTKKMIHLLVSNGIEFSHYDVRTASPTLYKNFKRYRNFLTFPQLYINGELYGGLDISREGIESGDLFENLKKNAPQCLHQIINSNNKKDFSVVHIRLPNRKVKTGYFLPTDTINDVIKWIKEEEKDIPDNFVLSSPDPFHIFDNDSFNLSLTQIGMKSSGVFVMKEISTKEENNYGWFPFVLIGASFATFVLVNILLKRNKRN